MAAHVHCQPTGFDDDVGFVGQVRKVVLATGSVQYLPINDRRCQSRGVPDSAERDQQSGLIADTFLNLSHEIVESRPCGL